MHLCQLNKPYKGARMRKWGKWVAEIRESVSNKRIWLGTYNTPVAAARAYDVALFYLRGPEVKLNFPEWMVGDGQHHQLSLNEVRSRAVQVGHMVDALQVQMRFGIKPSTNMSLNLIDRESDVYITPDLDKYSQMSLNGIDRESDVYITSDLNKYSQMSLNGIDRELDVYITSNLNEYPQMSLNLIDHESDVYITPDLNEYPEMSLNLIDRESDVYITPDLNKYPEMSLNLIDRESDVYITPDLNKFPQLES